MTTHPPPGPHARFSARALAAGAGLVLVAVPFALLLFLVQDQWDPLLDVDESARDDLHNVAVAHAWVVSALKVISVIGSAWVYVPLFALVAGRLLWQGRTRLALFVVVTVAGSALLNALVKIAVDRARPVLPDPVAHASGMSFPSGHAQSAVVAVSVLLLVYRQALSPRAWRVAVVLGVLWVLAIGFARVTLGVHYVSDVLAGYALGAAWVTATSAAFRAR